MAIDRIGVQPIIAGSSQAAGVQTYKVGEIADGEETLSPAVSCTNDLSGEGNRNVVHWRGTGQSYRIYKSLDGAFGLIGTAADDIFIDANLIPDTAQPPPGA